jgi:hypothetical protein
MTHIVPCMHFHRIGWGNGWEVAGKRPGNGPGSGPESDKTHARHNKSGFKTLIHAHLVLRRLGQHVGQGEEEGGLLLVRLQVPLRLRILWQGCKTGPSLVASVRLYGCDAPLHKQKKPRYPDVSPSPPFPRSRPSSLMTPTPRRWMHRTAPHTHLRVGGVSQHVEQGHGLGHELMRRAPRGSGAARGHRHVWVVRAPGGGC